MPDSASSILGRRSAEPIEVLHELQVALEGVGGVEVHRMMRAVEHAEAQPRLARILTGHGIVPPCEPLFIGRRGHTRVPAAHGVPTASAHDALSRLQDSTVRSIGATLVEIPCPRYTGERRHLTDRG